MMVGVQRDERVRKRFLRDKTVNGDSKRALRIEFAVATNDIDVPKGAFLI